MHFFHTNNLQQAFPTQPLLAEFIKIVEEYFGKYNKFTSNQVVFFNDLFTQYEKLTGETINPKFHQLVNKEKTLLEEGKIDKLLNKVIFQVVEEGSETSTEKAEFHYHTYDIQIVLSNAENYIFKFTYPESSTFTTVNHDTDTQFTQNSGNFKILELQAGEGVIIAPTIEHFAGFYAPSAESKKFTKAVVKIDAQFAKDLQLS